MRKLLIALILLLTNSLSAQNFDAGFVGGLTMSQISGDGLAGFDKAGARIGAYISYPIPRKKMNFEVGMQYVQKGSRMPSGKSISNYSMNLHYLEIPITVNYAFKNGLIIESGLGSGILFSYSEEDAIGDLNGVSPNIFGLDFICGIQYQLFKHVKFNLRYGNSLLAIRKEDVKNSLEKNKDWYSSMVTFSLMYQISR
tara:strand:- start:308 stop:901 length:594 start_codon:yes stop_codon:yes gene_type:complete